MKDYLKKLFTISTAGLLMAGLCAPAVAQEIKEAPLVSGLDDLRKLSKQLVAISEPSAKATVSLVSTGAGGAGSGVIVSKEGLVLTAAHVVASLSDEIIVIFPDGMRKKGKKLGGDYDRDAAMVQITEEGEYPFAKVGKSEDLLRNEWCVALGHPGGFDLMRTPPVRLGRVLNNGHFITTDCAVVGGDSGGPLFDVDGKVIGIHSNIGANLTENRHVPIGVYLKGWDEMVAGVRTGARFAGRGEQQINPDRPVLGINLAGPGEEGGVQLEGVMDNSPAQKVGLQAGDVVTKINGDEVNSPRELIRAVSEFKAGDELKISYLREGEAEEVNVKLARLGDLMESAEPERPRGNPRQRRGRREREEEGADQDKKEEAKPKEKEEAKPEAEPKADEDPKAKEKAAKKRKEREEQAMKDVEKMLKDAMKEGNLELNREQLKELGGMEELQRMMRELAKSIGPEGLREMMELEIRSEPDNFFESSMKALGPVTKKASKQVVSVQVNGKPVVLGTVVSKEGHILTKSTETREGKITRKVGEKNVPLKLVKRFPKRDLALFQGPASGLEPVQWVKGKKDPPTGTLLTTPDPSGEPLGIGLISVLTRALGDIGFLGIQAGPGTGGVSIVRTVPGSPAVKAGLQADDLITHIDGENFVEPADFGMKIRTYRAGEEVEFTFRRGVEAKKIRVKLAAREESGGTDRFRRMNEMSGPLSARTSGYPLALQHDIPLAPSHCGGPLLNLDGRCVGINVSRAGRVKTLAIPASDVLELLAQAKGEKSADPKDKPAPVAKNEKEKEKRMAERKRVLDELRRVEGQLKKLEKELEGLKE